MSACRLLQHSIECYMPQRGDKGSVVEFERISCCPWWNELGTKSVTSYSVLSILVPFFQLLLLSKLLHFRNDVSGDNLQVTLTLLFFFHRLSFPHLSSILHLVMLELLCRWSRLGFCQQQLGSDSNEIRRSNETMSVYRPAQDWGDTNYINCIYARSGVPRVDKKRYNDTWIPT